MPLTITDDRNNQLQLPDEPQRIVSLVPSDSYTLWRLGAGERLVGRTDYCVEPAELLQLPSVGGTKNVDVQAVLDLRPDLIVANQEENRRVDIERLQAAGAPVLMSLPKTVAQGLSHTERLLALLPSLQAQNRERLEESAELCHRLAAEQTDAVPTFVPIWMDPLMTVNGDTFISDVVELVGGRNVFADRPRRYPLRADLGLREPLPPEAVKERDTRYPRVTLAEVTQREPALVLLPDEPHEFTPADAAVFEALDIPASSGNIRFVNGRDMMWYGLRTLEGLASLAELMTAVRQARDT